MNKMPKPSKTTNGRVIRLPMKVHDYVVKRANDYLLSHTRGEIILPNSICEHVPPAYVIQLWMEKDKKEQANRKRRRS